MHNTMLEEVESRLGKMQNEGKGNQLTCPHVEH